MTEYPQWCKECKLKQIANFMQLRNMENYLHHEKYVKFITLMTHGSLLAIITVILIECRNVNSNCSLIFLQKAHYLEGVPGPYWNCVYNRRQHTQKYGCDAVECGECITELHARGALWLKKFGYLFGSHMTVRTSVLASIDLHHRARCPCYRRASKRNVHEKGFGQRKMHATACKESSVQ